MKKLFLILMIVVAFSAFMPNQGQAKELVKWGKVYADNMTVAKAIFEESTSSYTKNAKGRLIKNKSKDVKLGSEYIILKDFTYDNVRWYQIDDNKYVRTTYADKVYLPDDIYNKLHPENKKSKIKSVQWERITVTKSTLGKVTLKRNAYGYKHQFNSSTKDYSIEKSSFKELKKGMAFEVNRTFYNSNYYRIGRTKLVHKNDVTYEAVPNNITALINSTIANSNPTEEKEEITTPKPTPTVPIESKKGNLTGSVSYFYNNYVGYKPDVNARITIISYETDYKKYTNDELFYFARDGIKLNATERFYTTRVDVSGNFNFTKIPVGKYLLIVSSKGRASIDYNKEPSGFGPNMAKQLFGEENGRILMMNTMKYRLYEAINIEVKENETLHHVKNFNLYE